jgi:hypothetical protein
MTNVINMEDYLSIGELAEMTGLGVHTLRVWEKDMEPHTVNASPPVIEGIPKKKYLV